MNIKDNWPEWLFVAILVALVFLIVSLFYQPVEPVEITGYLVGKEYNPERTSTGVGSGVDQDGKPTTVITTSSESEKWTVVLLVDGAYRSFDVAPNVFYALPENQTVTIYCVRGKWIPLLECV